jgi:hypothetical protein
MKTRFAKPFATIATATLLLGACSDDDDSSTTTNESTTTAEPGGTDDGSRTLARGEGIDFIGSGGLADQTMDIDATEEDGQVTGEASFEPHGSVVALTCADTDTDGILLIGGQFTQVPEDGDERVGMWVTVVIREGDPDRAFTWHADEGTASCAEAFEQVRDLDLTGDNLYETVEDGDDIETA